MWSYGSLSFGIGVGNSKDRMEWNADFSEDWI